MDKYILQLLQLHSKVILPKFGAIVIEDEETGNLMFNEYLTYDDGKLSSLIEKESNMDLQEAQNMVAKFVRELQAQLDKGETYVIYQLGEFSKSENGEFTFEGNLKTGQQASHKNYSGPSPTPSSSSKEQNENPAEQKESEEKQIPTQKEEKKEDPPKEKKKATTDEKDTKKPVKKETPTKGSKSKQQPVKETKTTSKTESKSKTKGNTYVEKGAESSTKPQVKKSDKKSETVVEPPKKKRKKGFLFWFFLILLLLIISGSAYVVVNYEKVEEFMGWNAFDSDNTENEDQTTDSEEGNESQEEEDVDGNDETVNEEENIDSSEEEDISDSETPSESAENEVVEDTQEKVESASPTPQASKGNYHIIIGSFSNQSNAENLVSEFKSKGFDSKVIGQYGGLHFVSAQSYPSSSAAAKDLSRVKAVKEGAWIFKQ